MGCGKGDAPLKWHGPVWGIFVGRFKCRKMGWTSKEEFFRNNSVGLSMYNGPIQTVKYIWVSIWCMLDWTFAQNCRNEFTSFTYSWSISDSEEYKILDAVVPDELLAANANVGSYQIKEYNISSLVVILHCLNGTAMWHVCTA